MKHSFRLTVMVIGMLALTLALPGFVEGKSSGGGMRMPGGGGKGKSNSNNNNSSLSSVQTAQPESPEIVAARKTLADDKEALDAAVAKVWGPFSQTQAYLDAETAFNAASVNLKAAQAAMIAKLADSDDYKQAVKDRDDAKAAMQSAGSSSSDDNGGSQVSGCQSQNSQDGTGRRRQRPGRESGAGQV